MEKYSEYKESGNQWFLKVPSSWGLAHLKYITTKIGSGSTPTGGAEVYVDEGIKFIRSQNVYNTGFKLEDVVYISEDTHQKMKGTHVQDGDILLNITGGSIGRCYIVDNSFGDANVNQHVSIIRPKDIIGKYLLFYLQSESGQKQIDFFQTGGNREGLSAQSLSKFIITYPPLSEQTAIVAYLDAETAKMDKFVSQKEKEIDLLEKLKQRIIADAVTRGLDPNATLVPCDIPWIKQMPKGWKVEKVRTHFKERNTKCSDKVYAPLSVSKQGITPQLEGVAVSFAEGESRKMVLKNDFVVNSRSDRKGSCGVSDYDGSVSLISIVLEPRKIDPEYVHYLFRSNGWIEEFYRNGRGIVADLWTTRYQEMRNMYFPYPPLPEQQQIVAYIKAKSEKIDKLKAGLQQEIDKVKLFKQRLISDVVTGQVKVC